MTLIDLATATTPRALGDGWYEADIPDGWQQGKGAYGGIVLALLVRAMEAAPEAADRPIRTLQAVIPAPVDVGPARIRVEVLRAGTGVSTINATLLQGDQVRAQGTGIFGRERRTLGWTEVHRREVPDWRSLTPLEGLPMGPPFSRHFEWRLAGDPPFTGGAPEAVGWIRPLRPGPRRDAGYVTSLADSWWPGHFGRYDRPVPSATVSFYLQFCADLAGLDPEAPLLHVGRSERLADGYNHERRELWGEDGRLVAINQQTMSLVG